MESERVREGEYEQAIERVKVMVSDSKSLRESASVRYREKV